MKGRWIVLPIIASSKSTHPRSAYTAFVCLGTGVVHLWFALQWGWPAGALYAAAAAAWILVSLLWLPRRTRHKGRDSASGPVVRLGPGGDYVREIWPRDLRRGRTSG
jgi:hypothetical protein